MRRADKLFQLTNLIRAKQPITAIRIAEELGVSVRTVYRYIDDLSVSGIPIYGTTGLGYQLHKNFELPPLNLSEAELDALILGVRMVSSWTSDELSGAAQALAQKIEVALPRQLTEEYKNVVFAPNLKPKKEDREHWALLHTAIKRQNIISFEYHALDDCRSSREVYPLGLAYWGGKWTLGSWCTLKKNFRTFRVDRMIKLRALKENFEACENINLQAYLASTLENEL